MCCILRNFHRHAVAVAADDICIVQRKHGDVLISVYGGKDPPTEATAEVAKQVRSASHEPGLVSQPNTSYQQSMMSSQQVQWEQYNCPACSSQGNSRMT